MNFQALATCHEPFISRESISLSYIHIPSKSSFCCRNAELGSVVILTHSKQAMAVAPHTLLIPTRMHSLLVQQTSDAPSQFPLHSRQRRRRRRRQQQHLDAQPLVLVLHAGWHRVFSPRQQQLAGPQPSARSRHKCFGG